MNHLSNADLSLINAKVYRNGDLLNAGVTIENGKIKKVAKIPNLPKADKVIDLEGSILLPGVVDPHVHFREPGLTHKENFYTGSKAAAAGGVTTICDMPNTVPPTDTSDRFSEKKNIGKSRSIVDFGLHGMFTENIEEGREMLESGAVSLKLYSDNWTDFSESDLDIEDFVLTVHPENPEFFKSFDSSKDKVEAFLESRPRRAETMAIKDIIRASDDFHKHFCHVTVSESVDLLREKKSVKNISSEVTPHHLLLDRSDLEEYGSIAKMYPPLRRGRDRKSLLNALSDGVIDMVATDHAPHAREEKERGLEEAPGGVAGIETSLPLMFTLFRKGEISLQRMVEAMCFVPAEIFGLSNENGILKGRIQRGADADLVAIDQNKEWKIRGEDLHGKTGFTPFEGREVVGEPFLTLIRGEIVYKDGEILGNEGYGQFVPSRK